MQINIDGGRDATDSARVKVELMREESLGWFQPSMDLRVWELWLVCRLSKTGDLLPLHSEEMICTRLAEGLEAALLRWECLRWQCKGLWSELASLGEKFPIRFDHLTHFLRESRQISLVCLPQMLRSLPYLGLGIKNTTELELLNCRLAGIPADTVHVVDLLERIHPTRARTPTHSLLFLNIPYTKLPPDRLWQHQGSHLWCKLLEVVSVPTEEWEVQCLPKNGRVSLQFELRAACGHTELYCHKYPTYSSLATGCCPLVF